MNDIAQDNPEISRIKQIAIVVVVLLGIALAFMLLITRSEAIPDRAKFEVHKKNKFIVPAPISGQRIFFPIQGRGPKEERSRSYILVTWGELKRKDHPFHNFDLPPGPGWMNLSSMDGKFRCCGQYSSSHSVVGMLMVTGAIE